MPILDFEFGGDEQMGHLAQRLADVSGEILGSAGGHTWVKVRSLPASQYAESASKSEYSPVFISVLLRQLPELSERERIALKLSEATAKISGRSPTSVHVIFLPEGVGRVAFGGKLVK